ncbi:MAG: beta strand repeat-containing protein [Acidimicrobiales bacterium]
MAGYTRNDTAGNIADGNVISAAPLDGEFDAIQDAFALSTGHTHDGSTTGDGGPVSKLGPSQETVQSASTLATTTDITITNDKFIQFRDSGLKILSSADGQLDIDADTELEVVAPTVDIDASTAVTIDTATLTITGAANVTGDLDVDNINIDGNTIISTDTNGDITISPNGTGTVVIDTDLDVDNININGNTITSTDTNGDIVITPNGTGTVVIDADVDVDNLNIDGNTISSTDTNGNINISPNGTGTVVVNTDLDVDNININGNAITSTDTNGDITITPNGDGKIVLDGLNFPIADGTAGHFLKTDGSGQLSFAEVDTDLSGDSSPQLGGMLDVNGNAIGDGTLELIKFSETASAVNEITVTNAATGGHPLIQASGDDTNINLKLDGKGTGVVNVVDDLTVGGDLTVNGTTTTVATTNTVVSDSLIELGNGTSGSPTNDAGLVIERGSANNAFIGFDESEDKFTMGTGTFTGASTGNLSITKGTLVADIESSKLIATNTNASDTGTDVAIQIGASTDWTVVVTSSDELVFRHNGAAKMLLTTGGHLKVADDITAFADLTSYDGA